MFTLDVRSNIDEVLRRVDQRVKTIPVATSNALNTAAFQVRKSEVEEMKRVFDRPTRFTLNSLFVYRATVTNPVAKVYLKESYFGRHYLRPQIYGGRRLLKGFERVMSKRGILPSGMYAVPGSGAKMDAHGNMSRGQIMQIMSALQLAEQVSGFSANRTAASAKRKKKLPQFFVARPGNGRLPPGVWQRFQFAVGSAVKPVLIFVKGEPTYKAVFHFEAVAQRVAAKAFTIHFERELRGIPTGRGLSF